MKSNVRLLDILDKAEQGPIMDEKEFDNLVSKTTRALLKKHELSYDKKDAILMDDEVADRFFKAGLEMAEILGIYCTTTHRRMLFSKEEILEALRWTPNCVTVGSGLDKTTILKRRPEDTLAPKNVGGPFGTPIPEKLYSEVMESYIKEPIIDTVVGGNLELVHGRQPKTQSPWEVLLAWREVELSKAAAQRAGRPGIAFGVVENAVTEIGELSGTSFGGFPQEDWHHVCFVSELKTNYGLLIKIAHLVKTGCVIHSFYNPILGGYAGGADGVALMAVTGEILACVVNMATTFSMCPTHPFYNCDTAPELIWAISVAQQALNRNTNLLTTVMTSPVSGPLTESLLYECATQATNATVSGAARIDGVRSAVGVNLAHCSGLESRFNAEIAHAATGMTRKDANDFIKEFQKKYVPVLANGPIGKPFQEVYDTVKIQPLPEWQEMYEKVKEDIRALGFPLK